MSLSMNVRESQGGVTVLELTGNLTLGEECDGLRAQLVTLLDAGKMKIVLGMSGVRRVDSSGVGTLVEAVVLTSKAGGLLKLYDVPRLLHNTLTLHRLIQAFEIFATEDEALASFG